MEYGIKGNRSEAVQNEAHKNRLLADGYGIVDKDGDIIEKSPSAKVSYTEYAKLEIERNELKEELKELKGKTDAKLRKENEELRTEITEFKKISSLGVM